VHDLGLNGAKHAPDACGLKHDPSVRFIALPRLSGVNPCTWCLHLKFFFQKPSMHESSVKWAGANIKLLKNNDKS
jgi:hypothetical protein